MLLAKNNCRLPAKVYNANFPLDIQFSPSFLGGFTENAYLCSAK